MVIFSDVLLKYYSQQLKILRNTQDSKYYEKVLTEAMNNKAFVNTRSAVKWVCGPVNQILTTKIYCYHISNTYLYFKLSKDDITYVYCWQENNILPHHGKSIKNWKYK